MNKNSTPINLVLYLYNETQLTETVLTQDAIDHDEEVEEEFRQLVFVKNLLDESTITPRRATMDFIRSYSQLTQPVS